MPGESKPLIACTHCLQPLTATDRINRSRPMPCPSCGALVRVDLFPAYTRTTASRRADDLTAADQAGCYYHPEKSAVVPCAICGRFLCSLCDVEMEGRHICFSCLGAGQAKKSIGGLENRRTLYDGISLGLAVWPLLIFYITLVTAPVALFMAVRYWKAPLSIVPRTRIRFVAAFLIGLLQLCGWGAGFYLIFVR